MNEINTGTLRTKVNYLMFMKLEGKS